MRGLGYEYLHPTEKQEKPEEWQYWVLPVFVALVYIISWFLEA